jgi:hypothetical protein
MCAVGGNVPDARTKVDGPLLRLRQRYYWQKRSRGGQQELAKKARSQGVQKNMDARMAAAQNACKKKWGSKDEHCLILRPAELDA